MRGEKRLPRGRQLVSLTSKRRKKWEGKRREWGLRGAGWRVALAVGQLEEERVENGFATC